MDESDPGDSWLDPMREALGNVAWDEPSEPDFESATEMTVAFAAELAEPPPTPPSRHPRPREPRGRSVARAEAPPVDTASILEVLADLQTTVSSLVEGIAASEAVERSEPSLDEAEVHRVVTEAIRQSLTRARVTGAGFSRLEIEVRVLESSVARMAKRVSDLNNTVLARNRWIKGADVERLAEAADAIRAQLDAARRARQNFDGQVDKMLDQAGEGEDGSVASVGVTLLAHDLRSRVDALDDQQRRTMVDLHEWQSSIDERLATLRAELVREIRETRDLR